MRAKLQEVTTNFQKTDKLGSKPRPNSIIIPSRGGDLPSPRSEYAIKRVPSLSSVPLDLINLPSLSSTSSRFNPNQQTKRRSSFMVDPLQVSQNNTPRSYQPFSPTSSRNPNPLKTADGDYLDNFREFIQNKAASNIVNSARKRNNERNLTLYSPLSLNPESSIESNVNSNVDTPTDGMNRNVNNAVKKFFSKVKSKKIEDSQKFKKKFSVFKDMATFIDIKEYLPKLNAPEETQLLGSLGPVNSLSKPGQNVPSSPTKIKISNKAPYPYTERLKEIKEYLTEARKDNPKQFLTNQRKFKGYLGKTEAHFKQNEDDVTYTKFNNERQDENAFYHELEGNLRNNKYDKITYELGELEDLNYEGYLENLKKMLEKKSEDIDEQINSQRTQAKVFKDRSEKVINMLKRATKNIFKKSLPMAQNKAVNKSKDPFPHRRAKSEAKLEGLGLLEIKEEEDSEIKYDGRQGKSTGMFLTEMDNPIDVGGIAGLTFSERINSIKKKVNNVSTSGHTEYGTFYRKSSRRAFSKEKVPKNKSPDYQINKKVTQLLGKYTQEILNEADTQKDVVKTYKTSFGKLLDKVSLMYENDMAALDPKPVSELQILDYKPKTKINFGSKLKKQGRQGKKGLSLIII